MTPHLALALAALLAAPNREADAPPRMPETLPPELILAKLDKDGRLMTLRTVTRVEMRQETRQTKVRENGRPVVKTQTVTVPDVRAVTMQSPLALYRVFDTKGKELGKKALAERFKGWAPALLSQDGKKVDPFYLKFFKDGTPVITAPSAGAGAWGRPPAPDPKPAPPSYPKG